MGFKPAEMGVYTMSSVQKPFWLIIRSWSPRNRAQIGGQQMVLNTEFYMVCAPEING